MEEDEELMNEILDDEEDDLCIDETRFGGAGISEILETSDSLLSSPTSEVAQESSSILN